MSSELDDDLAIFSMHQDSAEKKGRGPWRSACPAGRRTRSISLVPDLALGFVSFDPMSTASVDTIAKLLDMTPRRVQQLANEGIIPKPKDRGQYEIVPCVVGYIKHIEGMLNGEAGDLASEKTRLTRAQADKTEIETARMKGELVSLADAERGWSALVGAFRAKMLTLPPRAATAVLNKAEKEAERILTNMVYEALAELSNWKPDDEDAETILASGSGSSSPASADNDKPVG